MASAEHQGDLLDGGPAEEEQDLVGARIGLAIVTCLGLVLGAATCAALWMVYPPARGVQWPMPTIGAVSALLLIAGYVTLRRRIGPVVADWFVVGYVVALVGMVAVMAGGQVVEFVRNRIEASRDT